MIVQRRRKAARAKKSQQDVLDEYQIRVERSAEIMSALSPQIAGVRHDRLDGHVSSKMMRRSTTRKSLERIFQTVVCNGEANRFRRRRL